MAERQARQAYKYVQKPRLSCRRGIVGKLGSKIDVSIRQVPQVNWLFNNGVTVVEGDGLVPWVLWPNMASARDATTSNSKTKSKDQNTSIGGLKDECTRVCTRLLTAVHPLHSSLLAGKYLHRRSGRKCRTQDCWCSHSRVTLASLSNIKVRMHKQSMQIKNESE